MDSDGQWDLGGASVQATGHSWESDREAHEAVTHPDNPPHVPTSLPVPKHWPGSSVLEQNPGCPHKGTRHRTILWAELGSVQ